MVNSNWTFTITHYRKTESTPFDTGIDITVDSFPRYFTDTGGEKVNAAKIRIIAVNGQYIQDNVNGKRQIQHNDRIRIQATDGSNGTYNKVFDVVKIIPIKSKTEGVMVELEMLGLERWLQKCNYSTRVFAKTPKEIFSDLITVYQQNRGTNTPTISLSGNPPDITINELPSVIKLHLDWGNNEDTIFNRMQELVEKMSSPQANGGVLDFYDIRFTYSTSNVTQFNIEVFTSGNTGRTKPSVTLNSTDINTEDTAGGFEEPQGLMLSNWGGNGSGSLPTNYSKFNSKVLQMPENLGSKSLYPEWSNTFTYNTGAIVKYTAGSVDKVYKALRETIGDTPNTSSSDWSELTYNTHINSIEYSPYTRSESNSWEASLANPSGASGGGFGSTKASWDSNIIISDDGTFRTWADVYATVPTIVTNTKTQWLYGGTTFYEGFRCFVKGTGTGDFAGFSECIMEYHDGGWIRKYELKEDYMVAVFEDAKVWRYDGSGSYTDFSTVHNGLDCFHPLEGAAAITNSESSIRDNTSGTAANITGNDSSAIHSSFKWVPLEGWTDEWGDVVIGAVAPVVSGVIKLLNYVWKLNPAGSAINTARNTNSWYSAGAWLCLRFPFPKVKWSSSSPTVPDVGSLYGGGLASGQDIVPHLDFQNMTYSADGKKGFNEGDSSEDLGPISSIDFNIKIQFIADNNTTSPTSLQLLQREAFPMRCVLIDRNDNVVVQDFEVNFNNNWEPVSLPLNGFNIYRGRKPVYQNNFFIDYVLPPKEKPLFTQFEWRHIAMMCIQSQDSYDEQGRYKGASGNTWGTGNFLWNSQTMTYLQNNIMIDALRFTKPLLVNSGQITSNLDGLNNEPDFIQSPDIILYDALKNNVLAEFEKHKFKNKRYDISTQGEFNIEFGDYFVLKDEDIVDETYNSNANQILLVAKHIEYEFSKPTNGSGGFERRVLGAKRFT